jgi:ABC-type branched-subunit amino acid transport system substrate-binding protein
MAFHRKSVLAGTLAGLVLLGAGGFAHAEPGVTKDQILVGSSLDLSGPGAPIGVPMREALDIGAQMINDHGGINGRKLKVITYDNALTVPKGLLAVQKLMTQDHVFAFVALMGNPLLQAAQKRIYAQNRAIMFPIAPLKAFYDPPQHLGAAFLPDFATEFAAGTKWAVEQLHKKKVCLLESQGMSTDVRGAVEGVLAAHHLKLAGHESYAFGAVDLSSQVARLKADGCDIVLLNSLVRDAASALREKQKLGWKADYLVAQSSTGQGLIVLGGKASEGAYGLATGLPIDMLWDYPVIKELDKRHQAAFNGKHIDQGFIGGYEAIALFAEAARLAGPNLTTKTLIEGLDKMKNFDPGVGVPPMSFSENKRLGSDHGYIIQVKNGKWTKAADW